MFETTNQMCFPYFPMIFPWFSQMVSAWKDKQIWRMYVFCQPKSDFVDPNWGLLCKWNRPIILPATGLISGRFFSILETMRFQILFCQFSCQPIAHTDPRNNHTKIMTWIEWNHFCHGPRVTQWPPWSSRFCSEFLFSQRFFSSEHIRTVCPIVIPV